MKVIYDYREYIIPEHLMNSVLNKYEVIITSEKWNAMTPKQE